MSQSIGQPRNPVPSSRDEAPQDAPAVASITKYDAAAANAIEAKWQDRWEREETFVTPNPGTPEFEPFEGRPKQYILDMFPYPSGVGLHVGHPLGYIATDIYARYLRAKGHHVLHAMGYDAFGLPAEQFAVEHGIHPRVTTERNIANMRAQLRRLGLAHDPTRSVATTDVSFYRWTQWIFLQIYHAWYDAEQKRARPIAELVEEFETGRRPVPSVAQAFSLCKDRPDSHGLKARATAWVDLTDDERRDAIDAHRLAYLAEVPVNWCPALGTVLANEEVTADGRSERGNHPVYKRPMKQWMMRITAYAERLLEDLEPLAWPEPIKQMQRNWIGRSEGAYIDFEIAGGTGFRPVNEDAQAESRCHPSIRVFTTRPDTLFGATYMVLAPEHPLVDAIVPDQWPEGTPENWKGPQPGAAPRDAVAAYRRFAQSKSDVQRQAEAKEKTGVFTGAHAVNPATGQPIPIFIADYVLMGYGTGAIMAVPGHDERDHAFAKQFGLPIKCVVVEEDVIQLPNRLFDIFLEEYESARNARMVIDLSPQSSVSGGVTEYYPSNIDASAHARQVYRGPEGTVLVVTENGLDPAAPRDPRSEAIEIDLVGTFSDPGYAVNSANPEISLNGQRTEEAKRSIVDWLERKGRGRGAVHYKLRDWLFSRQRYWGEPFPIVYDESDRPVALSEDDLPVVLPELADFTPASSDNPNAPPQPPLGRAMDWLYVTIDGKRYRRELNTMPQWAGSCWYYLRYLDPANEECFVDPEVERFWMLSRKDPTPPASNEKFDPTIHHLGGVDLYVGGVEHAVLHLLYARFWHKVLFDLGHVSTPEPFGRLFSQGYIQAFAYTDSRGVYVPAEEVEERDGRYSYRGEEVARSYGKMGKSLKNAVAPDDICRDYGADTLRLYEMSMGPLEASKPWNTRDIVGSQRFLQRAWRNFVDPETGASRVADAPAADEATKRLLHKTIDRVDRGLRTLSFNTAIAALIEFNNALVAALGERGSLPREIAEPFVKMLAPFVPHFACELWERPGRGDASALMYEPFPIADPALLVEDEVEVAVQVLGKLRGTVKVPAGADQATVEAAAKAEERVAAHLQGKTIRKIIFVPGKLVNFVVG